MQNQSVIHSDPKTMGGTPVFVGTRVPVSTLLEYLAAGDSIDEFLEDFPSVTKDKAIRAIKESINLWGTHARSA
jgi:uncharacterized protein (DUF433 family)